MKKTSFPKLVSWMFLSAVSLLLIMTVLRIYFFQHFHPLGYSFSNNINAFLLGLNFDARIACGIVLFPFLVGSLFLKYKAKNRLTTGSIIRLVLTIAVMVFLMIFMKKGHATISILIPIGIIFALILVWLFKTKNCNPFANKFSKNVFKTYFSIVITLLVLFYISDFLHYDYLRQRLNASVLNFAEDASISTNMLWQTYPVIKILILMVLSVVIIVSLVNYLFRKIQKAEYVAGKYSNVIIPIVFTLLLAVGLFGRINQYPLRWSDAFALQDDFKANLALNPVQSFLSTMEFRNSTYDIKKVKEYYPLMVQYLGITQPDSTKLNYNRIHTTPALSKPINVVVVICESFSAYKSSMWGNPLNSTPYFNEMCKNGIFFDRCFTPAVGTARGVWATVTGIPDVEYPNTASRNPTYVDQHSIINDYTGYDKFYFIGGSSSWANIRGLLTNNIDGLNLLEEENFKSKSVDVWGISDKRLFLEANKVFSQQKKPFFAIIQTADNHRPYTIPEEDRKVFTIEQLPLDSLKKHGFESNDEFNAFRYADFSFQTFIEAAKKEPYFNNTIFVFVGDHGIKGITGNAFPKAWELDGLNSKHVPLLFYSPALLTPQRIHKTSSQVDVLPSVSALADISYVNSSLGKNLFDTSSNNLRFKNARFIYEANLKEIGIVTDEYVYTHNLNDDKVDFRSSKDDLPLAKTPGVEEDRKLLAKLTEAYYQTAEYMLHNNRKEKAIKPIK